MAITSINCSDPLGTGGQRGSLSVGSGLMAQKVWDPVFYLNGCEHIFSNKKGKKTSNRSRCVYVFVFIQQLWTAEEDLFFLNGKRKVIIMSLDFCLFLDYLLFSLLSLE